MLFFQKGLIKGRFEVIHEDLETRFVVAMIHVKGHWPLSLLIAKYLHRVIVQISII
jgi:hypothetical protein